MAYLTVPYEKDLNRIYYMNWNEGIQYVKWCQRERNWDLNLQLKDNENLPILYNDCEQPMDEDNKPIFPQQLGIIEEPVLNNIQR